jgi:large subunit ribosomal protein L4e
MAKVSAKVYNLEGKATGKIRLPKAFSTPLRPDVIKRAVIAVQSHRIQPQGRNVMAGKRTTAESWGVGHHLSRVPRLKGVSRAAFAPGTVGGRLAFPPLVEKKIAKKITKKERHLALMSAVAATGMKGIAAARGHAVGDVPEFPLIVTDDIQCLKKTKDLKDAFVSLGLWPDVCRAKDGTKLRAGKGKMRGRGKKKAVGPMVVISKDDGIVEAAHNLPGVDVVSVGDLNVELLAPGTHPGRLTAWTSSSIESLSNLSGGE